MEEAIEQNEILSEETPVTTPAGTYEIGQLYHISPFDLEGDPQQPRKTFDAEAMASLVKSIKHYGVLQPVLFRQDPSGARIVVAGERRVRAAREAKLESIPALCTSGDTAEKALVENLLRSDLTVVEEAEAVKRLQDEAGYKNKEVAAIIGKAESTVSEILSLNRLPEEIRNRARGNRSLTRAALVKIVGKGKDEATMIAEFAQLLAELSQGKEPKAVPSATDKLLSKIEALITAIKGISFDELEGATRDRLVTDLVTLETFISEKLGQQKEEV
ncbi:ParB/RepB/Spo0J family partition protein [Geomonas propionica]|uniref:ParB/RepB/Spo0J family partition protein n=1 Tax=Geomonas propionica TaxID=2798582 RepID=A0ABS0YP95_9BACT|nr:ParB/RepB/Spo0J family partition protein [Geomonas propionica]MBJ6799735.1 ParB/RepB/Spo0J family partition protein [Geomonas propionica]